jgi:hypothetical protein
MKMRTKFVLRRKEPAFPKAAPCQAQGGEKSSPFLSFQGAYRRPTELDRALAASHPGSTVEIDYHRRILV